MRVCAMITMLSHFAVALFLRADVQIGLDDVSMDAFPLGPGPCVHYGNQEIASEEFKQVSAATKEACQDACEKTTCTGFYYNYICTLYTARVLRASPKPSSNYCWVINPTYALSWPFHAVFSPLLELQRCVTADVSQLTNAEVGADRLQCAVACIGGEHDAFSIGDGQCFCGTVPGSKVAGACTGAGEFSQYGVTHHIWPAYPQMGDECPGGTRESSLFIKSGDANDAIEDWEKVSLAVGHGAYDLCAQACTNAGSACHGYMVVTPTGSVEYWLKSINEESWGGEHSACYLARKKTPFAPARTVEAGKPLQTVCARKTCLEDTVCLSSNYHRISGYAFADSTDLIESSRALIVSTCDECAKKCLSLSSCKTYQCSESVASVRGSNNCLHFKSYHPEGSQHFNISDVALCRRVASNHCRITDGITPIGDKACACGGTTCIGKSSGLAYACYLTPTTSGVCVDVGTGCPAGNVRVTIGSNSCVCMPQHECDDNPLCTPSSPEVSCLSSVCSSNICDATPLAPLCVRCDSVAQTVDNACEAQCFICDVGATKTVSSGTCNFPNSCVDGTSDSVVCGSDGHTYRSACDVKQVSGVSVANAGPCVRGCTKIADTDCACGADNSFCHLSDAEYCSDSRDGGCAPVCDREFPEHTNCICSVAGSLVYCTGSAPYCPSKTLDQKTCVHEASCVGNCAGSLADQLGSSCRCGDSFCCQNEVCSTANVCIKVCTHAGATDCSCVMGNSTAHCKSTHGAWEDYWTVDGKCTCVPWCHAAGDTNCLVRTADSVAFCTAGKSSTAAIGDVGECALTCTKHGQSDCLCKGSATTPAQYCNTVPIPTYCVADGRVLDVDATSAVEKNVCAPKCDDKATDCFCLPPAASISSNTPLCISHRNASRTFCDAAAGKCEEGCAASISTESVAVYSTCQCGHDSNGLPAICNKSQRCLAFTTEGPVQYAQCSSSLAFCGQHGKAQNLLSVVGLKVTSVWCTCAVMSQASTSAGFICAPTTYCVAEAGYCLNSPLMTCDHVGAVIQDIPCYCCGAEKFRTRFSGIANVGDVCIDSDQCVASRPMIKSAYMLAG